VTQNGQKLFVHDGHRASRELAGDGVFDDAARPVQQPALSSLQVALAPKGQPTGWTVFLGLGGRAG
jgi:hypothetical protein